MSNDVILSVLVIVLSVTSFLVIADRVLTKAAAISLNDRKRMSDRIKELERRVEFLVEQLQSAQGRINDLQSELDILTGESHSRQGKRQTRKLNVLAVWSSAGGQFLDFTKEQKGLRDANVNLVILKDADANRQAFVRQLNKQEFDIVQISAHGNNGSVVLSDGEATPGWFSRALAESASTIQCVVLLACKTSDPSAWSVSDALISIGIPYVIGVSGDITNSDAISFTNMLYELISRGSTIEHAFDQARLIVSTEASDMLRLFKGK